MVLKRERLGSGSDSRIPYLIRKDLPWDLLKPYNVIKVKRKRKSILAPEDKFLNDSWRYKFLNYEVTCSKNNEANTFKPLFGYPILGWEETRKKPVNKNKGYVPMEFEDISYLTSGF